MLFLKLWLNGLRNSLKEQVDSHAKMIPLFIEVGGVVGIRSITIQLLNSMGLYDLSIMNTRTKRKTIILNFCFYKMRCYGTAPTSFEEKLKPNSQGSIDLANQ